MCALINFSRQDGAPAFGKLNGHLNDNINQGSHLLIPSSNLYVLHRELVVNSAFEGLNFEALDSYIIDAIINSVPLLELLKQRNRLFNQLSARLPAMQLEGDSCSYGEDDSLLAHMEWCPQLIHEIHGLNREIRIGVVDIAIPDVEAAKERLEQSMN